MEVRNIPALENPPMLVPSGQAVSVDSAFARNALLAGLSAEISDRILARIETLRFASDEVIFAEDDPGDCLYLIAQGSVKISKRGRGGQQETLTYLLANDYFGEMALVDSGQRSAQASTVGDTILGKIDHSTWDLLVHLAPHQVLGNFTRSVTQRLRQNNQHFIEQVMRSERLSLLGTTISSIVHDMNNPIMTILGASQVILSNVHDPLTDQMARLIREAVDKMETMTRELIDFSRGNTQLKLQLVSVPELVRQLEPDFTKCRVACDVQLDVAFEGAARIDRHRMLRVFGNLIRNAREAMKAGEANILRFSVHQVESCLRFEVSDTGHGIKSDILPKIFEPFMTHGKSNGTGLGLAISKAVIDAHGGTISAQSSDVGTTFRVEIPLAEEKES
jgi:signal transduction histidine kinase